MHGRGGLSLDLNPVCLRVNAVNLDQDLDQNPRSGAYQRLRGKLAQLYLSVCRFFSQGAVDVYNSDTVLVTGSNFSHNVLNNVSKPDPYRGHSAGLSLGK